MFSGKTKRLIKRIRQYEKAGNRVQVFEPKKAIRYDPEHIVSHDGLKRKAFHVENVEELRGIYNPSIKIMGLDEPELFESEIVDFCIEHVNNGGICVAAFLLKDCFDNFFKFKDRKKDTSEFVRVADIVTYLKTARCNYEDNGIICNVESTRVQRFGLDGKPDSIDSPLVLVGAKERYAPRCRKHYQFY